MTPQEQYIREILESKRYEVHPQHEAAFQAMLLQRKRRRRIIPFMLLFAGASIVAAWLLSGPVDGTTHAAPDLFPTEQTDQKQNPGPSALDVQGGESMQPEPGMQDELISEESTASDQGIAQNGDERNTVKSAIRNQSSLATGSNTNTVSKTNNVRTATEKSQGNAATAESVAPVSDEPKVHGSATVLKNSDEGIQGATTPVDANDGSVNASGPAVISAEVLNAIADASEDVQSKDADIDADVIPSTRQIPDRRLAFGLTASWSPAGVGTAGLETGHAGQVGGFATYWISPRWILRSDAGFGIMDGGFRFRKESESEVFGFSLLTLRDWMEIRRLYSGYLSAEAGWISGRFAITGGVQGEYAYGAKGDVYREEIPKDAPGPIQITSENVWVSVDDMRKISLFATVGVRSRITSRLEAGLEARIPILRQARLSQNAVPFDYTLKSPGIAPALSLSYQLSQQSF